MTKHYWLVKQEPSDYSWADFLEEGKCAWTGVRNFQARNFLRRMKVADSVLFYHSGEEKQVIGIAKVAKQPYPDPTTADGNWSAVDLAPVQTLKRPVTLKELKADSQLKELLLIKQSRLSVMPVGDAEFRRILDLAEGKA